MRLVSLHIDGFGKFSDFEISFNPGINIIYGRNEAGKSTLHNFIRAMFFGIDTHPGRAGKKSLYAGLRPWEDTEKYRGCLRTEHDGRIYRIERDFNYAPDNLAVFDEESGFYVNEPEAVLKEILNGLTETAYVNTISIGQLKSSTGAGMETELRRYAENLTSAGSIGIDCRAALDNLTARKRAVLENYRSDAALAYTSVIGKIKNLETALKDPSYENHLSDFMSVKSGLKAESARAELEKAEISERIRAAQETLKADGLRTEDDIDARMEEADSSYEAWKKLRRKAESRVPAVLAVILLIFAVFAGAAFCLFYVSRGIREYLYAMPAAAAFCAAAIILLTVRNGNRWKFSIASQKLQSMLLKETGNDSIGDSAMEGFRERMEGFRRVFASLESLKSEQEQIDGKILEIGRKSSICSDDIEKQQTVRLTVEMKLMELAALKKQAEELKLAVAENSRIKAEADALDIAMEKIGDAGRMISEHTGPFLNKAAGDLIRGITGGAYTNMDIGRNMEIYLQKEDRAVHVSEVSLGTADQLYLALRLAAVRYLEGDTDTLPLIFDDSFVLYDDERLQRAVSYIADSYRGQILIFTCHHREEEALNADGKAFGLIHLG